MRALVLALLFVAACGDPPPSDVLDYASCVRTHPGEIPPTDDDPHDGSKVIWVCGVAANQLLTSDGRPNVPYPDGTLWIKVSTKEGQDFPWLIASARKAAGSWTWNEYTRNFKDEAFAHIAAGASVCTDCHVKAKDNDYIFHVYRTP